MKARAFFAVVACLVLIGTANAGYVTLTQAQLNSLDPVFKSPVNAITGAIFDKTLVGGGVEYEVSLKDTDGPPLFATVGIGSDASALGMGDLSAYSGLSLSFSNVNNSSWSVAPFVQTPAGYYQAPLVNLAVGSGATVNLDFAGLGVALTDQVKELGFVIAGTMDGLPPNPSISDVSHILVNQAPDASTIPVPEPSTIALAVIGLASILACCYRRAR
ncbi:MAG: PEP-CTERM sorting domain-containing protein [Pirellulales bacterium]